MTGAADGGVEGFEMVADTGEIAGTDLGLMPFTQAQAIYKESESSVGVIEKLCMSIK